MINNLICASCDAFVSLLRAPTAAEIEEYGIEGFEEKTFLGNAENTKKWKGWLDDMSLMSSYAGLTGCSRSNFSFKNVSSGTRARLATPSPTPTPSPSPTPSPTPTALGFAFKMNAPFIPMKPYEASTNKNPLSLKFNDGTYEGFDVLNYNMERLLEMTVEDNSYIGLSLGVLKESGGDYDYVLGLELDSESGVLKLVDSSFKNEYECLFDDSLTKTSGFLIPMLGRKTWRLGQESSGFLAWNMMNMNDNLKSIFDGSSSYSYFSTFNYNDKFNYDGEISPFPPPPLLPPVTAL